MIFVDGHEQANWNGSPRDASTPVFDVDGQRDHFNSTELQIIEDAWAAAAEDFAPFDINVTTVDPGDMKDGISLRVAIGGYADDWYMDPNSKKKRPSGVSSLGNFTAPKLPNIAYVFAETIAVDRRDIAVDDVALLIGSTIAHEAGHATGLRRSEMASLTPRSFNLDPEAPTVTVEAAFSKHRRQDVIELPKAVVPLLGIDCSKPDEPETPDEETPGNGQPLEGDSE